MTRQTFLLIHRYTGLSIALFLLVAGTTGMAIAFYDELDRLLNPALFEVEARGEPLSLDELVHHTESHFQNRVRVTYVRFPTTSRESMKFRLAPRINPQTGVTHELADNWLFVDPYTSQLLGSRSEGAWRFDRAHIMPLLFRLHHTLALPEPWGAKLFGAAALVWLLDCFVGFYLTLPRKQANFLSKWQSAWRIKWRAGAARAVRDMHIALSLWLWGMLVVMALSAVMFNLFYEVYQPVLNALVPHERARDSLPVLSEPAAPSLSIAQARSQGRAFLESWQAEQGFVIHREDAILYDATRNAFRYSASTSLDLPHSYAQTRLYLSGDDGSLLAREHAYQDTGNAITTWLVALHMGRVFGSWYQVAISLLGLIVVAVTVSGVLIWRRKTFRTQTEPEEVPSPRTASDYS